MLNDFVKGLNILAKHQEKGDVYGSHEMVYVGGIDLDSISLEEVRELGVLGFIPGDDSSSISDLIFENFGHDIWETGLKTGGVQTLTQEEWDWLKDVVSRGFCYYT
jgi:hypothetical protein